jgi:hypothetical protein
MYSYLTGHLWNGCGVELTERLEKLQRDILVLQIYHKMDRECKLTEKIKIKKVTPFSTTTLI